MNILGQLTTKELQKILFIRKYTTNKQIIKSTIMKFLYFIAKRFSYSAMGRRKRSLLSGLKIATFGIAVGLAVMIIAVSVVVGFKKEVRGQIIGFGGHIQIISFNSSASFEKPPIIITDSTLRDISQIKFLQRIDRIVTKSGILKTDGDFKGVVFKGVDNSYDWSFFKKNLISGSIIDFSNSENKNKVLISRSLANNLKLKVGDDLPAYFFQTQVRARKFKISGIYSTTFSEFDNLFVICNLDPIRQLNGWDTTQISSLEIILSDFDKLDYTANEVRSLVGNRFDTNGLIYNTLTIKELYPDIFNWLDMLDINAWIIIVLMMIVAGFNMISGLLILILQRTQTIGIFKALGMKNSQIRIIFLLNAMFFVLKGMFWGNIIGLGLALTQYFTHIIPLNPDFYYTSYVPVTVNWLFITLLNIGVFVFSILMLILPSHIITKILPAKSIKFE